MDLPFFGGCSCGAIRYECAAAPLVMANCHCRDCQRASGGACASIVVVELSALKLLKGQPKYHFVAGDSGKWTSRGFCDQCGSPLFAKGEAFPNVVSIKPGSLDDPSWFKPSMDMWAPSAQPWDYMNPGLPKFDRFPPRNAQ